ncbi:hypothetical protein PoB_005533800 [Plakobranchus ocellatus]|uniref:Uncharacterized protein n=1 Tax=Plakobranchus ocellatus TaxID=259542 RepID=A0AAV4CBH0_9GAST|nr:hypothetical protein PoB_005533800 [Plakobranchus ocellatus]
MESNKAFNGSPSLRQVGYSQHKNEGKSTKIKVRMHVSATAVVYSDPEGYLASFSRFPFLWILNKWRLAASPQLMILGTLDVVGQDAVDGPGPVTERSLKLADHVH